MDESHAHHHPQLEEDQKDYSVSRALTGLAIGAGVVAFGVMLAPHILPALGVTGAELAEEASTMIHTNPMGIAGGINSALGLVPGIGAKLAEGGLFTAAASALTGIGGVLLGQFVESKEDDRKTIKWGTVIKYAALITSALIAMPAILSALSTGIIYAGLALEHAGAISYTASQNIIANVASTLGGIGGDYAHSWFGLGGLTAILPHLLCCGAPLAPTALSAWFNRNTDQASKAAVRSEPSLSSPVTNDAVSAHLNIDKPVQAGQPCQAELTLRHADGSLVTVDELAVVHTKKLHLFVVDSSLKDYQHIHPEPTGEPGVMAFSFVPRTSNNYTAWADFTMLRDNQNYKLPTSLPSALHRDIRPQIRSNNEATQNGLQFTWDSEPLQQNADTVVEVTITDKQGRAITDLQPIMGAFAHLVGFSADGQSIIHTHPLGMEPVSDSERGEGILRFHVEPRCSGPTQFYLQIHRHDEDMFIRFGQQIKPPERTTEKIIPPLHSSPCTHAGM